MRQILDQVLIANKATEDYRRRNQEGIIFKIDFEKAYCQVCHVERGFFNKVLHKKGFGISGEHGFRVVLEM